MARGNVFAAEREANGSNLVVLLHGLGTDSSIWAGTRRGLADRVRSIAITYLPPASTERFDLITASEQVLAGAVDSGSSGRLVVVGLSLGGMVAQTLCVRHPSKVAGLFLMSTNFLETPDDIRRLCKDRAAQIQREGSARIAGQLAARWLGPRLQERDPITFAKYAAMIQTARPTALASAFTAIATSHYHGEQPPFSCPVRVVVSEGDAETTQRAAEQLCRLAPCSEKVVIAGAGHMSPLEQPDAIADLIVRFVSMLSTSAPRQVEAN